MALKHLSLFAVLRVLLIIFFFLFIPLEGLFAQEEIYALHLKNGKELIGITVKDTINNLYLLRTSERELIKIPIEDVLFFTKPESVIKAPKHYKESSHIEGIANLEVSYGTAIPCKSNSFYFLEGSLVGIKGKKFYPGVELTAGFRIFNVNLGISIAGWLIREKYRFPVFLNVKYYPWETCWRPFLLLNTGYTFDEYTSKYNLKISSKLLKETGPKMIGGGIGVEVPLLEHLSLTVDGGYRYLTLSNEIGASTCDGIQNVIGYSEHHTGYLRIGVSF
jgi:hypothetical protein